MISIEAIYQAYPRHRDKREAITAIEKAIRRLRCGEVNKPMTEQEAADYLLERASTFARSLAGQRGYLTAYAATWFNRGGYMDDDHEWDLMTREEYEDAMQANRMSLGTWRPS